MKLLLGFFLGLVLGMAGVALSDHAAIKQAQQNEMQANGLEDQCRTQLKSLSKAER